MRIWSLASIAALALAGCSSEKEGTIATDDGDVAYSLDESDGNTRVNLDGPDGEAAVETGEDLTPDLPEGLTLYPGAKVDTVSNVGLGDSAAGTLVSMITSDSPDKVTAWYKAETTKAGYGIEAELQTGALHMISGKAEDGRQFSVSATQRDDGSSVQIIAGAGLDN